MSERDVTVWITILALGCVTVLTRGFFLISERDWKLPGWLERGLIYAPIAALAAVIAPEARRMSRTRVWVMTSSETSKVLSGSNPSTFLVAATSSAPSAEPCTPPVFILVGAG